LTLDTEGSASCSSVTRRRRVIWRRCRQTLCRPIRIAYCNLSRRFVKHEVWNWLAIPHSAGKVRCQFCTRELIKLLTLFIPCVLIELNILLVIPTDCKEKCRSFSSCY
jgi:hypothetical protein